MPNVPNPTRTGDRTAYEPVVAPTTHYAGREATAAVLFGAAALLYNWWLLEFRLPTGLDPRHSYVSELYAADQRFRVLFGALESGCALLVIAGALLARSTPAGHGRWARAGWLALAGLGLSSLADVLLPMTCAPSLEPGCEPVHPWHTATSAFAHFFLFASMACLSRAAAVQRPPMPLVRRWGPRVLAVAMPAAILTVGPLLGHPGWHGVPQRVHLMLVGVWFALLAAELGRSARRRRRWAGHWDGRWERYVEGLRRACRSEPLGRVSELGEEGGALPGPESGRLGGEGVLAGREGGSLGGEGALPERESGSHGRGGELPGGKGGLDGGLLGRGSAPLGRGGASLGSEGELPGGERGPAGRGRGPGGEGSGPTEAGSEASGPEGAGREGTGA
ncbi:DUF998 domain-containing protein [Streptomyces sp. NPDC090442]|uniref:DUF998 domain-containing protein n=1 Tax=Streptomyces sp. NPDC090442 TaxID=3365962 RepID=UPI0037F13E66